MGPYGPMWTHGQTDERTGRMGRRMGGWRMDGQTGGRAGNIWRTIKTMSSLVCRSKAIKVGILIWSRFQICISLRFTLFLIFFIWAFGGSSMAQNSRGRLTKVLQARKVFAKTCSCLTLERCFCFSNCIYCIYIYIYIYMKFPVKFP